MSPELAEAGRMDVKTSSARNASRKKICEILRNCGNLDWAMNFPDATAERCFGGVRHKPTVAPAGEQAT